LWNPSVCFGRLEHGMSCGDVWWRLSFCVNLSGENIGNDPRNWK
jgi:hypothetical protein